MKSKKIKTDFEIVTSDDNLHCDPSCKHYEAYTFPCGDPYCHLFQKYLAMIGPHHRVKDGAFRCEECINAEKQYVIEPIIIQDFVSKERKYKFHNPVVIQPHWQCGLLCADYQKHGISVYVEEYSIDKLINAIKEQYDFVWQEYAQEDDEILSGDAIVLKEILKQDIYLAEIFNAKLSSIQPHQHLTGTYDQIIQFGAQLEGTSTRGGTRVISFMKKFNIKKGKIIFWVPFRLPTDIIPQYELRKYLVDIDQNSPALIKDWVYKNNVDDYSLKQYQSSFNSFLFLNNQKEQLEDIIKHLDKSQNINRISFQHRLDEVNKELEQLNEVTQESYLARSLYKYLYSYYPYDGKTKVTIDENDNIINITASFQNVPSDQLLSAVRTWLCNTINKYNENPKEVFEVQIICNPAGYIKAKQ